MAAPRFTTRCTNLVRNSLVGLLSFHGGARLLSGVGVPVNGVTGRGKAGPGSLYVSYGAYWPAQDSVTLWENTGTKAQPIWQDWRRV